MLNKFKEFQDSILEIYNNKNIEFNKKVSFYNKCIQFINPKIRIIYNLSLFDFIRIVKNSNNFEEYENNISKLDYTKQYIIHTKKSYKDYIQYCIEEHESEILQEMENCKKEVNENLLYFATNNLNPKYLKVI